MDSPKHWGIWSEVSGMGLVIGKFKYWILVLGSRLGWRIMMILQLWKSNCYLVVCNDARCRCILTVDSGFDTRRILIFKLAWINFFHPHCLKSTWSAKTNHFATILTTTLNWIFRSARLMKYSNCHHVTNMFLFIRLAIQLHLLVGLGLSQISL